MTRVKEYSNQRRKGFAIRIVLSAVLLAVIGFSGRQLWKIQDTYTTEEHIHQSVMIYKPAQVKHEPSVPVITGETPVVSPGEEAAASPATAPEKPVIFNQSIADLKLLNSDAIGWVTINDTYIDYPFVLGEDNIFYLRRNINKEQAGAGTVFMDYRCSPDFSDFNTILYGHNMKNGSMFHDLTAFRSQEFFDTHTTGTIYLEDAIFDLYIFAYLVVQPTDWAAFLEKDAVDTETSALLSYLKANAQNLRDAPMVPGLRFVTLSTCTYEFEDARAVIVATLSESVTFME